MGMEMRSWALLGVRDIFRWFGTDKDMDQSAGSCPVCGLSWKVELEKEEQGLQFVGRLPSFNVKLRGVGKRWKTKP